MRTLRRDLDEPLYVDDQPVVRPYVIAHEKRERRRVLYYAVRHGVGLDTSLIQGGVSL